MPPEMPIKPEAAFQELKDYLNKEIRQHQNAARFKSGIAQFLFWGAIAASFIGTVNPATKWFPSGAAISILAAIPGVVLLIMNTFKYDARSKWHKLKQRKLDGLYRGLAFENKGTEETSAALTLALEELDKIKVDLEAPSVK
jgi:hypothetical protein